MWVHHVHGWAVACWDRWQVWQGYCLRPWEEQMWTRIRTKKCWLRAAGLGDMLGSSTVGPLAATWTEVNGPDQLLYDQGRLAAWWSACQRFIFQHPDTWIWPCKDAIHIELSTSLIVVCTCEETLSDSHPKWTLCDCGIWQLASGIRCLLACKSVAEVYECKCTCIQYI